LAPPQSVDAIVARTAVGEDAWPHDAANVALPQDWQQVGSGTATEGAPVVTMAIDARFTMWATLPGRRGGTVVSDAGQLVLHSHEPDESAVLDVLRRRHGQLAVAQALCEGGILEIHRAICQLRGVRPRRASAAQVVLAAARAEAPECAHAIAMFCGLLGDVAGRAALTFGATGGVVVTGPIAAQLGASFARSPFRRRFDGAGRLPDMLRAIPTFVTRGRPQDVTLAGTRQGARQQRLR
jgi:glucokinase